MSTRFQNSRSSFSIGVIFPALVLLGGSVGLLPGPAFAQEAPDIQRVAEDAVEQFRLPGAACAIIRDGRVVAKSVAGVRRIDDTSTITTDDRFHIGSCTKAMTATLAAILIKEGKLTWETDLGSVFPEYQGVVDDAYLRIPLIQWLNHRAGVPANAPYLLFFGDDPMQVRDRLTRSSLKTAPERAVGEFLYSNLGYIIAGHMMEKVTGESWESLMRSRLFRPLGMESAGFGPPRDADRNQPAGHRRRKDGTCRVSDTDNPPVLGPAGRVHCTLADWGKFLDVHLNPSRYGQWVDAADIQRLHEPPGQGNYAAGWLLLPADDRGEVRLAHSGSNTVWMATVVLAPERNLALVAATNVADDETERATMQMIQQMEDCLRQESPKE